VKIFVSLFKTVLVCVTQFRPELQYLVITVVKVYILIATYSLMVASS